MPLDPKQGTLRRLLPYGAAAALLLVGLGTMSHLSARTADPMRVPPPATDMPAATPGATETAVLSGGCFWGVQGLFQHVDGVTRVLAGYSGGAPDTADYETVSTGTTGHAESVQVTFDPSKISYGRILQVFFSVALDPTQVDRQGPDSGSQYRSEIFVATPEQQRIAEAYIRQLDAAGVYGAPIATRVDPLTGFVPAEAYHQDYLVQHPDSFYIVVNDQPKVGALQALFPELWRDQPVLASAAAS